MLTELIVLDVGPRRAPGSPSPLRRMTSSILARQPCHPGGCTISPTGSITVRMCCARRISTWNTASPSNSPSGKHAIAQGFFLYTREPGGNRIEIATGSYLIFDPDWEPVVWTQADRAKGQAWRQPTIASFHTYGTPMVDSSTAAEAISTQPAEPPAGGSSEP